MEELLKAILEELKTKNKQEKATFTREECAKYMGISLEKVTELIKKENTDFPYFKNNSKYLILKRELDEWMDKVALEHRCI